MVLGQTFIAVKNNIFCTRETFTITVRMDHFSMILVLNPSMNVILSLIFLRTCVEVNVNL